MPTFNFTTGPATLPDVGQLSYNGCIFSPLFATKVSGTFIKDAANRTTKDIEYTIEVDGYVTLPAGNNNVETVLQTLEKLLSAPAGVLLYSGRGIKINVGGAGGDKDVAWGPIPEILEITPLGGGLSAQIKWTVKTRIPPRIPVSKSRLGPVLQFNYETVVTYTEDGYSQLRLAGIVEIPLTRSSPTTRTLTQTADNFRRLYPGTLLSTIDLTKFRVTHRDFKVSRDKRTLEFDVTAEELPCMAMPPDCTLARGQFTFRPAKAGVGLCNWLCTLTATYTVPKGRERRLAWFAFLAMLRERMRWGNLEGVMPAPDGNQNPGLGALNVALNPIVGGPQGIAFWRLLFTTGRLQQQSRKVWLIDFNGSEGMYLDSKTITFSATWRLTTIFSSILLASGLWRQYSNAFNPQQLYNTWALNVRSISGFQSWLPNQVDPNADAIVDFGY